MSRPHRSLDELYGSNTITSDYTTWWDDGTMAEPTWDRVQAIAVLEGRKLYKSHRLALLRDDLLSYLTVHAMDFRTVFKPNPDDALGHWLRALSGHLRRRAQWHFREYLGRGEEAQRVAYTSESVDHLLGWQRDNDPDAEYLFRRTWWHHHPEMEDPLQILIRRENLYERLQALEQYGPMPPSDGLCDEPLCGHPVSKRGLCNNHYAKHRRLWGEQRCNVEGCAKAATTKQMCDAHYQADRTANHKPPCTLDGCDRPVRARGLCGAHYEQQRTRQKKEQA